MYTDTNSKFNYDESLKAYYNKIRYTENIRELFD